MSFFCGGGEKQDNYQICNVVEFIVIRGTKGTREIHRGGAPEDVEGPKEAIEA